MYRDSMVPLTKVFNRQDEFDLLTNMETYADEKIGSGYVVLTPRWSSPPVLCFPYRAHNATMPEVSEKDVWYEFPSFFFLKAQDGIQYVAGYHVFPELGDAEKWRGKDVIIHVKTAGWCASGLLAGQLEVFVCRALRWV